MFFVPLVHRKVGDPEEFEVGGGLRLSKSLCLSAYFFARSRRSWPTRFHIHCLSWFQAAGVPGLGVMTMWRGELSVVSSELSAKTHSSAVRRPSMASARGTNASLVRRRATSRKSRPESPKGLADFVGESAALRSGESADAGNGEAEDRERGVDLEGFAELGRNGFGEVDHRGQAHVGLVDAVFADGLVVGHLHEIAFGQRDVAVAKAARRKPSTTRKTVSCLGNVISRSIWVKSGWRSARRSSSRKQRATWK